MDLRPTDEQQQLIDAVTAIPSGSLVLYIRYSQEQPGHVLFPKDVARLVTEASPVPVYGISESYVGVGIVGGSCDASSSTLFDAQDLCADPDGNLIILSTDGTVTDPDPNVLTERSSALVVLPSTRNECSQGAMVISASRSGTRSGRLPTSTLRRLTSRGSPCPA